MITITANGTVNEDGRLIIDLGNKIPPGQHQITIIIDDQQKLYVKNTCENKEWPADKPVRREDLY